MLGFIAAIAVIFLLIFTALLEKSTPNENAKKLVEAIKDAGEVRTWTTCKCSGCKSAWHSGEIQKEIEQATNRLDKETEKLYWDMPTL